MKKYLLIFGVIILLLVFSIGGIMFWLTRGIDEGAVLQVDEIDLTGVADGTYHGSYQGGRWSNELAVTVSDQKITNIKLIKDMRFVREEVTRSIFESVIREQSTQVDLVTEATVSSKAYLKAIENALAK